MNLYNSFNLLWIILFDLIITTCETIISIKVKTLTKDGKFGYRLLVMQFLNNFQQPSAKLMEYII